MTEIKDKILYEKVKKEKQSAVILSLEDPEIKAQINAHPDNVFKYIPKPTSKNKVYLKTNTFLV